jgi:hypothetical protein
MMIQTTSSVSADQLCGSLKNVLGEHTLHRFWMEDMSSPRILELAMLQAFVHGTGSEADHAVLRASAVLLERTGVLPRWRSMFCPS